MTTKKTKKIIIGLLIIISYNICKGQEIKTEIGKSVWLKNGELVVDSVIDHKYYFDQKGHEYGEWKISRDEDSFHITDTTEVFLDSMNNYTHVKFAGNKYFYFYDSIGSMTKMLIYDKNGKAQESNFRPVYSASNKLTKRLLLVNGQPVDSVSFSYRGDTTIESGRNYIKKTVQQKNSNRTLYQYTQWFDRNEATSELRLYEYDSGSNLTYFQKFINDELVQWTKHKYISGHRVKTITNYTTQNYKIITRYSYEYW